MAATTAFARLPSVELPRGGGAIRGIDETFTVEPVTGTATLSLPIATSSGRGGFGPRLALTYDSGAGNGPFGFGWQLSLPAVTRRTDRGLPSYGPYDVYQLSGTDDLVPDSSGPVRRTDHDGTVYDVLRYRPRIEGLFARIERWTACADGDVHWRSVGRDGITTIYGPDAESRIAHPCFPERVFSWLIRQSHDPVGNVVLYEYLPEDSALVDLGAASERHRLRGAQRYLHRVRYGNCTPYRPEDGPADRVVPIDGWMFEVLLDFEEDLVRVLPADEKGAPRAAVRLTNAGSGNRWAARPDPFSTYRAGFEVRTHRRCRRILMLHSFPELGSSPCLVRSTDLEYAIPGDEHDERLGSMLRAVTQTGYVRDTTSTSPTGGLYRCVALPPVELEYTAARDEPTVHQLQPGDLPLGLTDGTSRWADLDSDGVPGLLTPMEGAWYYRRNLGAGALAPPTPVATAPSMDPTTGGGMRLLDLAGDGRLDIAFLGGPVPGWYEREPEEQWSTFKPLDHVPIVDWSDPRVHLADLTGDGLADILQLHDLDMRWFRSLGEQGFDASGPVHVTPPEYIGSYPPAGVDRTEMVVLADMSGDGLVDLVRVRNGSVVYWPNTGYGRFGQQVVMDDAPWFDGPDLFDPTRLRMADLDGSGTTDLIYLHPDGPRQYLNRCGNGWTTAKRLPGPPTTTPQTTVDVFDLLGTGTACLVWSSSLPTDGGRSVRYLDLTGGVKPRLLRRITNNLGATTTVSYAPSTRFSLADRAAGRPWRSLLPFPVHVVERTETIDSIGGVRRVSRYAYHDGHYDGEEREFHGFGMVERYDTDEFDTADTPPSLVRTWYHTGRSAVADELLAARWQPTAGDAFLRVLPSIALPGGLTPDEERQAVRAVKGRMLREEVFGLDGGPDQDVPYTVTDQSWAVRCLQPANRTTGVAVFLTHAAESISRHHERRVPDPRVRHAITLEVDAFGNVLSSVGIGYGRVGWDPGLEPAEQALQARDLISWTRTEVTCEIDSPTAYRTPLAAASSTYEVTALPPAQGVPYTAGQVRAALADAREIGYYATPAPNEGTIRLIERMRTRYRRDDLTGPLPPGQLEPLALPFETYRLALTDDMVAAVYGDRVDDTMLAGAGYVRLPDEPGWWTRSGRVFYSPDPSDGPDRELVHARAHFYLPHRFRSPFHTEQAPSESVVTYAHDLLVQQTCDPLGNRVTAGERAADDVTLDRCGLDLRVLAPRLVMDANRNRSVVAFDALGLVVASATMGATEDDPCPGDQLDGDVPEPTPDQLAALREDPLGEVARELLGTATERLVRDLGAPSRDPSAAQPAWIATLRRETHLSDLEPGELSQIRVSFAYSDGLGRQVQRKDVAEPDPLTGDGRWTGTGWRVMDAKGRPVRSFEPFFSPTHHFERAPLHGVSAVLCYDPLDRVVATLHPDRSWSKLVLDPWSRQEWDGCDTAGVVDPADDPDVGPHLALLTPTERMPTWTAQRLDGALGPDEQNAAEKTLAHAGTPGEAHSDPLGRTIVTLARACRSVGDDAGTGSESTHRTRTLLDIEGNTLSVVDQLGRVVTRRRTSLVGTTLHETTLDAGERVTLGDVAGSIVYSWNGRRQRVRTEYDRLRRPVRTYLREGFGPEVLVSTTEYGEDAPDAIRHNLRTRRWRVADQAGRSTTDRYDFKGNLLRSSRRLAVEYRQLVDWSGRVRLKRRRYVGHTAYDALDRPVRMVEPDGTVIRGGYGQAGLLENVTAQLRGAAEVTTFVGRIDYDARGRRVCIEFGNRTRTEYSYDPLTFRLSRLITRRAARPGRRARVIQDVRYSYDPVGNVTRQVDDAQQAVFHANRRVDAHADYTYDALYRLVRATGREQLGTDDGHPSIGPRGPAIGEHAADGRALARYVERYRYDRAGNLLRIEHRSDSCHGTGWTRSFHYAEPSPLEPGAVSNRLTSSTLGGQVEEFSRDGDGYDVHGGMLRMPHLAELTWDHLDRLRMTRRQMISDDDQGKGERTWYVYDVAGTRVRKVTERRGRPVRERIYVGAFEEYREHGGRGVVRETVNVLDDARRVALIETRTRGRDRAPDRLMRYQVADRLGSTTTELDEFGRLVTHDEYAPYGACTLRLVRRNREVPKRYGFTGKELDEESGLAYHGIRYYAPWLGRWTTSDPGGLVDGTNTYSYVNGRPTRHVDPDGQQSVDVQETMMAMMWDRMGQEFSGMIEGLFGGSAYVSPRSNVVEYSGPEGGVGGVVGGVVRATTLRLVPIEKNPSLPSLMGMEAGAAVVPVVDPAQRLVSGTTVTGQETSRGWAAFELGIDIVPLLWELRAARVEARMLAAESRMMSMDTRMLSAEADLASHIGAGEARVRQPTITNPTCRGDLCVADVGAHELNLRNPGLERPITNTELVAASGRDVSRMEAPLSSGGEAAAFLDSAFEGLVREGRVAAQTRATVHLRGEVSPGNYLAVVDGPQGGHAIHATVTDEVIGRAYIAEGRFVGVDEAAGIAAEGGRVVERTQFRVEFYDPQNGVCLPEPQAVRSWIRFE